LKEIEIEDLAPGMLLAKPLIDITGRTLLQTGTKLTARYVSLIKSWGFDRVAVEAADEEEQITIVGYQVLARPWEEIMVELDYRFRTAGDSPAAAELKRAIVAHMRELKARYG